MTLSSKDDFRLTCFLGFWVLFNGGDDAVHNLLLVIEPSLGKTEARSCLIKKQATSQHNNPLFALKPSLCNLHYRVLINWNNITCSCSSQQSHSLCNTQADYTTSLTIPAFLWRLLLVSPTLCRSRICQWDSRLTHAWTPAVKLSLIHISEPTRRA